MTSISKHEPFSIMVRSLKYSHPEANKEYVSIVSIHDQRLYLYKNGEPYREYPVSTSRFGIGNQDGSHQTPLGLHRIVGKIGEGEPLGAIFKARKPTGEIVRIFKSKITMPYDQVTSRILRLEGLEPGINKGTGIDTFERYIYIHGTHEEGLIGQPASIGCVRMTNRDVIELFGEIPENSLVLIIEGAKDQAVLAGDHRDQSATN